MVLFFFLLLLLPLSSHAHSRWSCPEPRSLDTGIKTGPCGDETNIFSNNNNDDKLIEIAPGPLRVTFVESVHHTGAPFRITLSNDGSDTTQPCILLDHIPHNDCCSPNIMDENTYTPYVITITIPNVSCEKCSLHLTNPMTDKIGIDGSPSGIGCTDPNGTCFSVYHSCTMPFKILGNVSTGAVPREEYNCPYSSSSSNSDWPTSWMGDDGMVADASVSGVYRRISSIWSTEDYTLTTVPEAYTKDTGDICKVGIGASSSSSSVSNFDENESNHDEPESNEITVMDKDEPESDDVESTTAENNVAAMEDEMTVIDKDVLPGETIVSTAEDPGMQASSAAIQDVTHFMGVLYNVLVVTLVAIKLAV
jgi:hypothetical protein